VCPVVLAFMQILYEANGERWDSLGCQCLPVRHMQVRSSCGMLSDTAPLCTLHYFAASRCILGGIWMRGCLSCCSVEVW